jgi:adenylate kinase family enzyme
MCTREQIREREKRGKEANGLDRNEWMSRTLYSEAVGELIGAIGTSG